jgi:asparagine synthase (glutamine-hydrolysing)
MPDGLKQHGRNKKYILKETFKDLLPEATIHFSKKGFDVPVDHWLREDLREDLERLTGKEHIERQGLFDYDFIQHVLHEHFTGKENHKNKLWNLYVFQKWYEQIYG